MFNKKYKLRSKHFDYKTKGIPDNVAVASLPKSWKPKRGGEILQQYLSNRKSSHENSLIEMNNTANYVNADIDSEIRKLTEILKEHTKNFNKEINNIVYKAETEMESRDDILIKLNNIHTEYKDIILQFRKEASELENQRLQRLTHILKKYFQVFLSIGFRLPSDILHDFDVLLLELKKQLISNERAFSDVEVDLNCYLNKFLRRGKSILNQIICNNKCKIPEHTISNDKVQNINYDAVFENFTNTLDNLMNENLSILNLLKKCSYNDCFIDAKNVTVANNLEIINKNLSLLKDHSNKSSHVNKTLIENTISSNKILFNAEIHFAEIFLMLHAAFHLWDNHISRIGLLQKLIITGLNDMQTNNDEEQLSLDIKINIMLEQMRQNSDGNKLHELCNDVMKELGVIGELYRLHNDMEMNKLDTYLQYLTLLTTTLMCEIDVFQEKYSLTDNGINEISNHSFNELTFLSMETNYQLKSLRKWKYNFLCNLESLKPNISDNVQSQALQWIKDKKETVSRRYHSKMVSHVVRSERVKSAFNLRKAEIEFHQERLKSHIDAIRLITTELETTLTAIFTIENTELYPLTHWINDLQSKVNVLLNSADEVVEDVKILKMNSYLLQLDKHRENFEESIEPMIEIVRQNVRKRIQEARESNLRFIHKILLFSDGGNYGTKEAEYALNALVKSSNDLETFSTKILGELMQMKPKLISIAVQYISALQRIIDENSPKQNPKVKKKY